MKSYLMFPNQDFTLNQTYPENTDALIQDLELTVLLKTMAAGDDFIYKVVHAALLCSLNDVDNIRYRQEILQDCIKNAAVIQELYAIPIEAIVTKQKRWLGIFSRYPTAILSGAIELLGMYAHLLRKLKKIADEHIGEFESAGFKRFFTMIQEELDDAYFAQVENLLKELKFNSGVLVSAALAPGNECRGFVLRKRIPNGMNWVQRMVAPRSKSYTFSVHPRDDHGIKALGEIRDHGINIAANAVAQSADHIDSFVQQMRLELAFYLGCMHLHERMQELETPVCYPVAEPPDARSHSFKELRDVCLALTKKLPIVGNTIDAPEKPMLIITGANQGGKSTFLRSIGLAQLMMQCGMFVAAESMRANVCSGLFTHYRRREDATMKSGKLDEELSRMNDLVKSMKRNALVLFNESFAATNEREGSEIATQITRALLDNRVKIVFVTHQYEFAIHYFEQQPGDVLFLRAERQSGGSRSFRIVAGPPQQTSFGADVYRHVFSSLKKDID